VGAGLMFVTLPIAFGNIASGRSLCFVVFRAGCYGSLEFGISMWKRPWLWVRATRAYRTQIYCGDCAGVLDSWAWYGYCRQNVPGPTPAFFVTDESLAGRSSVELEAVERSLQASTI